MNDGPDYRQAEESEMAEWMWEQEAKRCTRDAINELQRRLAERLGNEMADAQELAGKEN